MNANELADRLKLVRCLAGDGQVLNEAEAMLRQQEKRLTKYELRHEEQRKRIDELEEAHKRGIELAKKLTVI